MDNKLVEIFKKTINDQATVKSDIVDYLVEKGGPGPAMAGDEISCFNRGVTIDLDGNYSYNITSDVYCAIACFLAMGKIIKAVKMLRTETGKGLKATKEAVQNPKNWNMIYE
jgi:hypothetical protein